MLIKSLCVAVSLLLAPLSATAASFNIVGGTADALPASYNPNGSAALLSIGSSIRTFSGATGATLAGGLELDGPATISASFIGKEAGARNMLILGSDGASLSNRDALGTSASASFSGGVVDFAFQTMMGGAKTIVNGGLTGFGGLRLAFSDVFNDGQSVIAYFGDGRGDADFDDMVVRFDIQPIIAVIPLPASGVALGAALLLGIGLARRRRRR